MSLLYFTPICHIDNIHFIGQDHRGENTARLIKKTGLIGIFRRIMAKKAFGNANPIGRKQALDEAINQFDKVGNKELYREP